MSGPPRRPSSPSSSQARRPGDVDDVTWLDFLRTAGGRVPMDRSNSSERKRPHTGTVSPERRNYPHPEHPPAFSGRRSPTTYDSAPFGTSTNPVDLIWPPRERRTTMPRTNSMRTDQSGRARYIVAGSSQAPQEERRSSAESVRPKWQADADVHKCPVCQMEFSFWYRKHHCRKCGRVVCAACSPHRITIPRQYIVQGPTSSAGLPTEHQPMPSPQSRHLGGGEVVRVCNPCVPDPWTPSVEPDLTQRNPADTHRRRASLEESPVLTRYRPMLPPPRQQNPPRQTSPTFSRSLPQGATAPYLASRDRHTMRTSRPPSHRHTQSSSASSSHPLPTSFIPVPPRPPPRQIPEEDECPVCGLELPPGPADRETHISSCITSHTPSSLRPRAASHRPSMAIYRATEKDCINAEGDAQECIICFEEFQPGDEMGRMECWCKFHRLCIRGWWEKKGVGVCPTHMLHD